MAKESIVIIHTGDGKGKTTAALGLCLRAMGWNKKVCVIQFLKSSDFKTGERKFFETHGIEMHTMGIGYTWKHTEEEQRSALENAWKLAVEKLNTSSYELILLDEILGALSAQVAYEKPVFNEDMLISTLKKRPSSMDVVLTGRGASENLIAFADLVTEMKMIKHPYSSGIKARAGIEY